MNADSRRNFRLWLTLLLMPLLSLAAALWVLVATQDRQRIVPLPAAGPTPTVDQPLLGERAPNFELPTLDGGTLRLSSLRGRMVFVNFWASWCDPCRREFPAFEAFAAQQADALVLAVNVGETPGQIRTFLDEVGAHSVRVLLDVDFQVSGAYHADLYPSTFVVDPAGMVTAFHLGEITLADLNGYRGGAS
ncbi:MAG: redoxin domain-containing protein [Anaerolineae bacterium]|nr:redoxin domain-containing protein [Anaerolineae bacterium]